MVKVCFKPTFVKQYARLEPTLKDEVKEKIKLFQNIRNHRYLRVHKLKGKLRGRYGFSVNYRYRIIFAWLSKTEAVLLGIGDHDVYDS